MKRQPLLFRSLLIAVASLVAPAVVGIVLPLVGVPFGVLHFVLIMAVLTLSVGVGGFFIWRHHQSLLRLEQTMTRMVRGDIAPLDIEGRQSELAGLYGPIKQISLLLDERRRELADQIRSTFDSELAAEKQRMEAFLRGIGDGISIVDSEMRIIYVNDAITKVFGDHTGDFCYKVYEHKTTTCGGCPVRKAMETGEVHHSLRRMYDKTGRLRYYETTGSPIRDERGDIIAGIELARDVTQRIKLERSVEIRSRELAVANEELRRANEQLQKAFEDLKSTQSQLAQSEKMASLGVLVSGIAHEINNPLNFVSASIQLLNDNIKTMLDLLEEYDKLEMPQEEKHRIDTVKENLEYDYALDDINKIVKNISTGSDRMKQIVQNLRTFSRLDTGENAPVDLKEGIESTLQILYYEYKNRIDIIRDIPEDLPQITGSPGKLNQVFMNILHNAIQAIEDTGKITIVVSENHDNVRVSISDTGPGIGSDEINNIFDPFYTTKKVGEGTGLGLSISYSIVQDHGGKLSVESMPGKGTTFHVDLPIRGKGETLPRGE